MEVEFTITPGFQDGCQIFVLEGELDMGNADRLEEALDTCTDGFPVVVDMSALTFIESTGLHALLKQRDHGRPSALVRAPASNIARVLDLIDAGKAIPVYGDVAEAVDDLRAITDAASRPWRVFKHAYGARQRQ